MKTVYKIDTKGKIRFVRISTNGDQLIQESGTLFGGSTQNVSTCNGKNPGKANETTSAEQAVLEAKSKIAKKLKGEYFELTIGISGMTQGEVETLIHRIASENIVILPMLAKDYKKEKGKVTFPCFAQPKLDGMRCLGSIAVMMSRENSPITTLPHIQAELEDIDPGIVLDGELYAHGLSFQENMKIIKKNRPGSEKVKYHVYDLISDKTFEHRYIRLSQIIPGLSNIELVPTYKIFSEKEMLACHKQFLSEGYEGTIIRHSYVGYENNKRSSSLLKYKDFLDIACKVIDVIPSEKRPEQAVVVVKMDNGRSFNCGMKFSHSEREEILRNKDSYIGRTAEVRFFEYSDTGIPRFPVCVGFREDK